MQFNFLFDFLLFLQNQNQKKSSSTKKKSTKHQFQQSQKKNTSGSKAPLLQARREKATLYSIPLYLKKKKKSNSNCPEDKLNSHHRKFQYFNERKTFFFVFVRKKNKEIFSSC